MNETFFDYLIHVWQCNFFIAPFILVSQLVALYSILKTQTKGIWNLYFLIYCIAGFYLFFISEIFIYYILRLSKYKDLFIEINNLIFLLIEYFLFTTYFKTILTSKFIKKTIPYFSIFLISSILLTTLYLIYPKSTFFNFRHFVSIITFSELNFIGILCLCYIYELFQNFSEEKLTTRPSFWIVFSSLLYFIVIPIVFVLHETFRLEYKILFRILISLHYLAFGFVYLGISKGFICNRTITI